MSLEIAAFAAEHQAAAATLLAARHRRDRAREAYLPARFADPAAALAVVQATAAWASSGVVALRAGRLVGYLLGGRMLPAPTSRGALFVHPRSTFVPYAGHAVDAEDGADVYTVMYEALAPTWLDDGYFLHYLQVPATDQETLALWQGLGFGCDAVAAARDTGAVGGVGAAVDVRRAGPDDIQTVMRLATALHRHHAGSPMFLPYLPETEPDERSHQEKMLADPSCAHWLAFQDGRALGMQSFEPAPPFISPLIVPEHAIYLLHGFTALEMRGSGVGTALLARAMAWAREQGHAHCLLHFLSANAVGAGFWVRSGFRSLERRLYRRVDERIAWARR